MDMVTGVSYPSETQVHVPTPSTPPGPAEELAESEGNLEWLGEDINEYYRGPKSSCGKEALRPPREEAHTDPGVFAPRNYTRRSI